MIDIVYCVFKDSWDGPELIAVYRSEDDAKAYVETRTHKSRFTIEEWEIN